MSAAKKNGRGHLGTYSAYVFKSKDPAIHELQTVIEDHFGHRVTTKDLGHIHEAGGPSVGAMHEWFFGKTERPQNPTLEAAGRAIGYHRVWQRMKRNTR